MRSLFWKGLLAFLVVILVAVGAVAVLTGRLTENAFRRYALVHGALWDQVAEALSAYYKTHGSWEGIQGRLQAASQREPMRGRGRWRDEGMMGPPPLDFRLADPQGHIVGDTHGVPRGTISQTELDKSVPIKTDGRVVGYLFPNPQNLTALPLNPAQVAFLARFRKTLWIGALAALGVALVIGGLLFRSITAPLRELTAATEAIAEGDLSARAPVRGEDEVGQLATAFNEMAKSLDRMEEARRSQTADIAHELRTPLTVVQGTLEAMLDDVYPANRENLSSALAQMRTLSRLIEDLRILALADAGRLELHEAALNLTAFLRKAVEAHRLQAQEEGVALALEAPADLPTIAADPDRLMQVMGNLLDNAFRYVPEGGHVTVRAEAQEQEVVVAVIDDGPGVPPEDLPHLFDRFWRADPARQRDTGGSGLGLSIARHIVEAHGGRIWAQETPGGGLTVAFSLSVV